MGLPSDPDAGHPDNDQRFELFESNGKRRADAARRFAGNRVVLMELRKELRTTIAAPDDDAITPVDMIETHTDLAGPPKSSKLSYMLSYIKMSSIQMSS